MAHFHTKKKKGRPYLYVREIARVDGKPKVISQIYIGSPERVAALASGKAGKDEKLKVEEFGALWVACQMDRDFDLIDIVDTVVPRGSREEGPTVGEYFLYAVLNRMVGAVSKNRLTQWYQQTAIQHIRPIDIKELTSQNYWEKWDRVSEKDLHKITTRFFDKLWQIRSPKEECLLFDTTNYYTFIDSSTPSELAQRGKNKEGRNNLRQIGLGLLVERGSRLPLYYSIYPGNLHDSHYFEQVMDEMFSVATRFKEVNGQLTVVIDKGMNSEENFTWIDNHPQIHFITTYSTYFAEKLAQTPLSRFEYVETVVNQRLVADERFEDCMLAYRTKEEFWGKERTVVVTFNPLSARKKNYTLDAKLDRLRGELLVMRDKVKRNQPHWRDPEKIQGRYQRLCKQLHLPKKIYSLEFNTTETGLTMRFRKHSYAVERKRIGFGRNIIITDNHQWSTVDIVEASLDRWQVEDRFRQSKDDDLVGAQPVRHWTDSKIHCHLFTCIVAMTYLRLLELKLEASGIKKTADVVMNEMRHLHSVLSFTDGRYKPLRRLECPTEGQSEVLETLGYQIDRSGVLQKLAV
jgi:transposase